MRITGIIESELVKVVCLLRADDFGETARKQIALLDENDWLPTKIKGTESGDVDLDWANYPYEKLKEILKEKFVHEYYDGVCYALKELNNLIFVSKNIAQRFKEAIGELENAPVEINVDLYSWEKY